MPCYAYVMEKGVDTLLQDERGEFNWQVGDYIPNNQHVIACWKEPGNPPQGWYAKFGHAYTYSGGAPSPTYPEKAVECPPYNLALFSGEFTRFLHFHVIELGTGSNAVIKITPEMAC